MAVKGLNSRGWVGAGNLVCTKYCTNYIVFVQNIDKKPNEAVSRFGLTARPVSEWTSFQIYIDSPSSLKVVFCGHCLVTLSLTIN